MTACKAPFRKRSKGRRCAGRASRLVILEFESVEQAKRWYHSDEYAPLKDIRLKATISQAVLVQGIYCSKIGRTKAQEGEKLCTTPINLR